MAGVRYERTCSGCGGIVRPYAIYPVDLNVKPLFEKNSSLTERFVALYGCNKCDLLNIFEIDYTHVRYFRDLELARRQNNYLSNPTWECKDCNHDYDVHSDFLCLGTNEKDGKRVQDCKCNKFAFVQKPSSI